MIQTKRIYHESSPQDGERILVDRVWPRGMKKEEANIDDWYKVLAPSTDLRKWFGHDPEKWGKFRQRYRSELQDREKEALLTTLADKSKEGTVTLLYGSKDTDHNNAVALKSFIDSMAEGQGTKKT
jgi:uncharacterized protein YeaO (DUF488 family)